MKRACGHKKPRRGEWTTFFLVLLTVQWTHKAASLSKFIEDFQNDYHRHGLPFNFFLVQELLMFWMISNFIFD